MDLPILTTPLNASLNNPTTESMLCTENWMAFSVNSPMQVDKGRYLVATYISINGGGSLSIAPGVVMKFASGTGVVVNAGGSFSSEGTKAAPVVLTRQNPTPGYWSGITVASNSNLNRIEHTNMSFAGGSLNGIAAAVKLECNPTGMLYIANSMIEDSVGWGVVSTNADGCAVEFGENVLFNQNRSGDIGVQ